MQPKKTETRGIKLSDGAAEESDFAEVVAIGPCVIDLKVGDIVLRPTPADYEWTDEADNNQLYLIAKEEDIPCRVRRAVS